MKRVAGISIVVALVVATVLFVASGQQADPSELTFVNVPSGSSSDDVEAFRPILAWVSDQLGIPVKYVVATDYAAVLQAMRFGFADLARVGAFNVVQAEALFGASALVVDVKANTHQPFDYALILARTDLGIQSGSATADQLRGLRLAYVDPTSTTGGLVPRMMLQRLGLKDEDFSTVYYAGSHDAAIIALAQGTVDLACCNDFRLGKNLAAGNIADGQFVVALQSDPIPTNAVIVRPGFAPEFLARLTAAWLSVPKEACAPFALDGFASAAPDPFGVIRQIVDELDYAPDA